MRARNAIKGQSGVTLMEMTVSIVIMAVLCVAATTKLMPVTGSGGLSEANRMRALSAWMAMTDSAARGGNVPTLGALTAKCGTNCAGLSEAPDHSGWCLGANAKMPTFSDRAASTPTSSTASPVLSVGQTVADSSCK